MSLAASLWKGVRDLLQAIFLSEGWKFMTWRSKFPFMYNRKLEIMPRQKLTQGTQGFRGGETMLYEIMLYEIILCEKQLKKMGVAQLRED